jgi:hypothetical protein
MEKSTVLDKPTVTLSENRRRQHETEDSQKHNAHTKSKYDKFVHIKVAQRADPRNTDEGSLAVRVSQAPLPRHESIVLRRWKRKLYVCNSIFA